MRLRSAELQLKGYRLTTAEILYHLPDYPELLQSFVWQSLDMAPSFPRLKKFLDYWETQLEGALHSVRVANAQLIKPAEFRMIDNNWTLH
ncbi:MAG: Usg family protein [Rhodospirillaceae bacterium]|jgi:uncharacterized protein Usg